MKALVIFPSIRNTPNFGRYAANFSRFKHDPDVMVIDENDKNRQAVNLQFRECGFTPEFFGVQERREWCHKRGVDADLIIPQRSHDELSFGLLVALTRKYDMVCFIDDDTYPSDQDYLTEHQRRLSGDFASQLRVNSEGGWVNTHPYIHARGYPYCQRPGAFEFSGKPEARPTVLNMGLWEGIPDLNAIDYLTYDFSVKADPTYFSKVEDFHLPVGQYAPICSMNVAFKPEVIPAFYQLWDNNRFNDIFSGLFLKRIADHLGKYLSVGNPLCFHDKAPRNLFRDAAAELASVELNEGLWKALNLLRFAGDSWLACYRELAVWLNAFYCDSVFSDAVYLMSRKMLHWCDVVEKLREAC